MDYHALVIRSGDKTMLDFPAIICRAWHPSEDPDLVGDDEELAVELDLHARGYRMCQCYSRYEPHGEFGHVTEGRLLAIRKRDFDEAVALLDAKDLPEYEECVYNAVARAQRPRIMRRLGARRLSGDRRQRRSWCRHPSP